MPRLGCPAVVDGFRSKPHADGLLHLSAQPQDAVHIVAVLDSEFIDLDQEIFYGDQANETGIIIVVLTGATDWAVIEKVGRLTAQPAQGAFKSGDEEAIRFVS